MHDATLPSHGSLYIYPTRYGDESRISSLMGVIQAIISFFQDGDDAIKYVSRENEEDEEEVMERRRALCPHDASDTQATS